MRRNLATVLAIMLAFASASVLALGLGEIRLNSYLNQRLDAEIELVSATAEELETLEISLADRKVFEQQGIPRLPELSSLKFRVVRRPNGTAYIKVTSTEPMKEPFLTFLIEIEWSRGRLLREYTLLLDPPTFKEDREAIQEEQARAPVVTEQPAAPAEDPTPASILRGEPAEEAVADEAAPAEEEPVRVAEETGDTVSVPALEEDVQRPARQEPPRSTTPEMGGNYGPIQRSETLWGIAQRLRPDSSITMNQMMLAIYRANPEAFMGNINRLKAGYILRIPEYDEITALTASEAFREAKRQNEAWRGGAADDGGEMFATAPETDEPAEETEPSLSLVAPEETEEPDLGMEEGDVGTGEAGGMADADAAAVVDSEDDIDEGAVDLGVDESGEERLGDVESETLQAMQDSESGLPDSESAAGDTADDSAAGEDEALELPPLPGEEAAGGEQAAMADSSEEEAAAGDSATEDDDAAMAGGETADDAMAESETAQAAASEAAEEEPGTAAAQQDSRTAAPVRPAREPSLVDKALAIVLKPLGMAVIGAVLLLLILVALLMRKRRSDAAKQAAAEMSGWDEADFESDDDATVVAADEDTDTGADEDATEIAAGSGSDEDDFQGMFGGESEKEEDTGTQRLEDDAEATQMLADSEAASEGAADDDFTDTMVGGETQMLDENDPLSEADFHMAYGLYDQAAEVIQKAIGNKPDSKELKVKLAEVHFAADNKEGFIEAAKSLHDQVGSGDADWNNIVIMGKQIAGDNPLFAEGGGGGGSVDLDFAAGEAEAEPQAGESVDFDLPAEEPAAEETPQAGSQADDEIDFDMDFGLGDEGESEPAGSTEEPAPSAEASPDEDLDFDLNLGEAEESGGEDATVDFSSESSTEPSTEPSTESGSDSDDDTQTEFDKALQELSAYVDTNAPDKGGKAAEESGDDLNLDEFNFDSESGQDDDASADDLGGDLGDDEGDELGEIGTKLDLARAYIDMGDPDGARSILEEVVAEGDDEQKKEAQELIDQLG